MRSVLRNNMTTADRKNVLCMAEELYKYINTCLAYINDGGNEEANRLTVVRQALGDLIGYEVTFHGEIK